MTCEKELNIWENINKIILLVILYYKKASFVFLTKKNKIYFTRWFPKQDIKNFKFKKNTQTLKILFFNIKNYNFFNKIHRIFSYFINFFFLQMHCI